MMPLIDVIFLLMTFFIFALVMMVQVNAEGVQLPRAASGEAVETSRAATITLNEEGEFQFDGEPLTIEDLESRLGDIGEGQVYIAPDVRAPVGRLFDLMGVLKRSGVTDFRFVRQTDTSAAGG